MVGSHTLWLRSHIAFKLNFQPYIQTYFSTKTYVVGTQKNCVCETQKNCVYETVLLIELDSSFESQNMFKLMGKKI